MSRPSDKPVEPDQLISCDTCLKEIPSTDAHNVESDEYVHHFCGLDCYDRWRHKGEHSHDQAASDD